MDACLDLGRRVLGRCPTSSRILIQGEKPEDISSIHQEKEKEKEEEIEIDLLCRDFWKI
jgi:hypothetical protein